MGHYLLERKMKKFIIKMNRPASGTKSPLNGEVFGNFREMFNLPYFRC